MAVGAKKHALFRFLARTMKRPREPAARDSKGLRCSVGVMKLKSAQVPPVSAYRALATGFGSERFLVAFPASLYSFGIAFCAPGASVCEDEKRRETVALALVVKSGFTTLERFHCQHTPAASAGKLEVMLSKPVVDGRCAPAKLRSHLGQGHPRSQEGF
jgi:hypothetical protein